MKANREAKSIDEDLSFLGPSLDVIITACMSGEGGGHLNMMLPLFLEMRGRIERIKKQLQTNERRMP